MANISYIKGVRTRFRNVLEREISVAKDLLTYIVKDGEEEEMELKISKCMEKLKSFIEKVETQSEKLCCFIKESVSELIGMILDEDCSLCTEALDLHSDLKHFKEKNVLRIKKSTIKEEAVDHSTTKQLLDLQANMQKLLESQLKQKEHFEMKSLENVSTVKLPKIEMISFGGDKTKWIEFWDSFKCAVDKNKSLTDVERFNYLKTKLFGEAKFAIAGLALSNENYKVAVDILLKRFGNLQEIIDVHYNELINMQPASNKVESLRCLSDKVERHLRSLEVLKQNVDQDIFVSILRSKLPEDVLIQLEIQKGVDVKWTVTRLNKQLQEYLVARERAVKEKVKDTKSKTEGHERNTSLNKLPSERYSSTRNGVTNMKPSATALVTTGANAIKKPFDTKKQCRYCQKAHWSDECNQYKTIRERRDRVKGSCFKCLKPGHLFNDCKTNKACVYCGKMNAHHRSLCPKKFSQTENVTHLANDVQMSYESQDVRENGLMAMNEVIFMQTARTEIQNPETMESSHVRILFDSGSHRSYMSEALAQKMN